MKTSKQFALALALGSVLALWLGLFPTNQPLAASGSGLTLLVDTDGDGLDDALEARLGYARFLRDSDGDQVNDGLETVLGTNPAVAETVPALPSARLALETYALDNSLVLQIYALYQGSVRDLELVLADRLGSYKLQTRNLRPYVAKSRDQAAPWAGWRLQTVTLRVPRRPIDARDGVSIGVRGLVDGMRAADHVVLMQLGRGSRSGAPVLAEVRLGVGGSAQGATASGGGSPFLNMGQGFGNGDVSGGNGGLFPVDPTDGGSGSGAEADFVCYQVLEPVASLGGARMLYRVVQASCEPMAGAVCLPGCQLALGRTIIGFDPAGLLGG